MSDNTQQITEVDLMGQDITDDVREDLQRLLAEDEEEKEDESSESSEEK